MPHGGFVGLTRRRDSIERDGRAYCGSCLGKRIRSRRIVARRPTEPIGDGDPGKLKAVVEAMMTMVKFDVAELERACNEA